MGRGDEGNHMPRGIMHTDLTIEPRESADNANFGRCPRKSKVAGGGTRSWDWWPCELNLHVLRQNSDKAIPLGSDFDYATEFDMIDGN
jgi:catalase-peroxidase